MLVVTALIALQAMPQAQLSQKIQLVERIADYLGYKDSEKFRREIEVTDPSGATYPGYTTIQLRYNGQTALDISISNSSGSAYDFTRCLGLEYPPVLTFKRRMARLRVKANQEEEPASYYCDRLKVERRP
jgi:hypothetical protein